MLYLQRKRSQKDYRKYKEERYFENVDEKEEKAI